MTAKNFASHSPESFGLDSGMKPIDPSEARQPLSDDVLDEMQPARESNYPGNAEAETSIENPDAIARGNSDSGDRDVAGHQIIAANRSAS